MTSLGCWQKERRCRQCEWTGWHVVGSCMACGAWCRMQQGVHGLQHCMHVSCVVVFNCRVMCCHDPPAPEHCPTALCVETKRGYCYPKFAWFKAYHARMLRMPPGTSLTSTSAWALACRLWPSTASSLLGLPWALHAPASWAG